MKKLLILHSSELSNNSASYIFGYIDAFKKSKIFSAKILNIVTHNPFSERTNRWSIFFKKFDAIVLLHSVFASSKPKITDRWLSEIKKRKIPIIFFIANEFYKMPQKIEFARELNISLLVTQCFSKKVIDLYKSALNCDVIGLPNTIFDEDKFKSRLKIKDRPIDIGYRMMPTPPSFGHWDRENIAEVFTKVTKKTELKTDISMNIQDRLGWKEWTDFLKNSKTQLCVPSGGNIFELTDKTVLRVLSAIKKKPNLSRKEISKLYPPKKNWVPLRTLSSRMIEAAAAKSVQIMYYEDIGIPLIPNKDFIELNKDHSNVHKILEMINDTNLLEKIAENCFKKIKKYSSQEKVFADLDKRLNQII